MPMHSHTREVDIDSVQSDGFDLQHVLESARHLLLHQVKFIHDGKRDSALDQVSSLVSVSLDMSERLNRELETCHREIIADRRSAKDKTQTLPLCAEKDPAADDPAPQPCHIEMEELQKLTVKELHAFREAVNVLYKIASAYTFQPSFTDEEKHRFDNLNGAGKLLQKIADQFIRYQSDAIDAAEMAQTSTPEDAECRNWMLLAFKADIMASELSEFVEFAAECEKEVAEARAAL